VLLPDGGGVLCYCGRLYATDEQARTCTDPAHRPVWWRRLQTFLAWCLAVLMVGAIAGGLIAAATAPQSTTDYRIPDSGYPFPVPDSAFQSGAP
jgi:hypothetical protein